MSFITFGSVFFFTLHSSINLFFFSPSLLLITSTALGLLLLLQVLVSLRNRRNSGKTAARVRGQERPAAVSPALACCELFADRLAGGQPLLAVSALAVRACLLLALLLLVRQQHHR